MFMMCSMHCSLIFILLSVISGTEGFRIINGQDANKGSHPHQVTLQYLSSGQWRHVCGGSVIGVKYVLTAAHCADFGQASEFRVVVNDHRLFEDDGTEQIIPVVQINLHDDWFPSVDHEDKVFPNDIAILSLGDDVIDTKAVIPLADYDFGDFANTNCTISGWGYNESFGSTPNILQEVDMTVISDEECMEYWPYNIFGGQICIFAGSDNVTGAASCSGDSGGPLVCEGVLAGVTSWGILGCRIISTGEFVPSVYTRVSYYYTWIQTIMGRASPWRG